MANHTPGPWVVHQYPHATGSLWLGIGYRLSDGTERGPICDVVGKQWEVSEGEIIRHAAEIKYLTTPEGEQWANARLISTAPELMAALIHARNGLQQIGHEYGLLADMAEDMALIDAAIAKARGEASRG